MMKRMTRIAALGAACALLLTGCGGSKVSDADKQAAALTVDGVTFTAQEYAAALLYNQFNLDAMRQYGLMSASGEGHDDAALVADMAQEQLQYIGTCENRMDQAGLTLDETALEETLATQQEQLGGEQAMQDYLKQVGIDETQYRRFTSLSVMADQLQADYMASQPEAARTYFNDNYLRCKHVLVKTVDDQGQKLDDQDGLRAKAEEIAARAKAGEDFDSLIASYNEDPGMEANPEGYVFAEGTMVEPFYEGTKALAVDAVSDPVETDYGWHIILRLPLRDADWTANQSAAEGRMFAEITDTWVEQAAVEEGEALSKVTLDNAADYLN